MLVFESYDFNKLYKTKTMNLAKALGLFFTVLFYANFLHAQSIFINEFMASNGTTIADENGEFDDWVEFYNAGPTAFDLGGKYVTDDLSNPTKWQIPTTNAGLTTIPSGGYIIVWFDGDTEQGELHADPKLGGGGEQIGLYDSDGITPIDFLTYGQQIEDISEGRFPDGTTTFANFSPATPGAANANVVLEVTEKPVASPQGGLYTSTTSVTLTSLTIGAAIYYTTDGSDPTESSTLYTSPISVSETTVLRARAFLAGNESSKIATNSYFINTNSTFPIVSFSGDPDKFFGSTNGMFTNVNDDIEHPINVEFYEVDGTQGFNQVAEVELHGNESVNNSQKSLAIKAKGSLGGSTIDYAVFPDEPLTQYRSLILRNSGQDWRYTMFRDAMESSLIRDVSDIDVAIEPHNIDDQAYRPTIAYVNGEYWGFFNIRERYDWRYLKTYYDLDDDEVDLIDNLDDAKEGDYVEWNRLDSILESKSFTDAAGLAELDALVDLDNFRDYILINAFVDNVDWPGTNNRRWRERVPDGKWRWMLKDLDFTFGLLEIGGGFNTGSFDHNILDDMLNNTDFPTYSWSTLLFRKLMENPVWQADYVNRTADQLNVLYNKERLLQRIDDFQAVYQPEVPAQLQRWNNIWTWENDINVMRTFANGRTEAMRNHYVTSLSDITGTSEVTLTASPANGGQVRINTITTDQNNYPWTGTYFDGIEVPIEAIPNPGFFFVGWSSNVAGVGPSTTVTLSDDITITAIFAPDGGGPIDQTISFPTIADKSTTSAPFTISATASSGLPVSFSIVSGPATILGNTITLNGTVGTVVVSASQAGNAQFNPALNVNQSFEVMDSPLQDQTINFPTISDKFVSSTPFTLNATATSGLPVSYNVVSGPASISGNTITLNGTIGTVVINASQAGNAQFNPAPNVSQTFQVIMDPPNGEYCESIGNSPWQEYIANVNLGTINNSSGKEKYEDFTALSTNLEKGQSYPIALTPGFSWAHYNEAFSVWIDWNGDFDFEDAGEQVFSSLFPAGANGSTPNPVTGTIIVPNNATNGITRMRITMQRDLETAACGMFNLGETEDYSIVVSGNAGPFLNITCPDAVNLTVPFGSGGTTVTWANPTVNGDCPIGVNSAVQTSGASNGSFFSIGSYIIAYEVTDNCGNSTNCSFTIDITEDTPGTTLEINCPANIALTVPVGSGGTAVTWALPTTNSDCPSGGITLVQTGGQSNGSFFGLGSYVIEYSSADNCNNVETCTFSVTISEETNNGIYCDSEGNSPWNEYIGNVNFGSINNDSGKDKYEDFTNLNTTVAKGGTYPIILTPSFSYFQWDEHFTVWIDWNQDFDFDDAGEKVVMEVYPNATPGASIVPVTSTINVPLNAVTGTTRMRVTMQREAEAPVCGNFEFGETEDYSVNVMGGTMTGLTLNCPQPITVTTPAGTTGTTIDWSTPTASTDCAAGINTIQQSGGQPSGSFFNIGSYIIEYTATDNCGNNAACSFVVNVIEGGSATYCDAKGNSPWNEYIGNVALGSINNTSGKNQYGDFTNLSTALDIGSTNQITLTPAFSYNQWDEVFSVWIDYNGNGSFDDAGELVVSSTYAEQSPGSTPVPVTANFTVPVTAQPVTTLMRVAMKRNTAATSCETFNLGEVEDYTIQLINPATANRSANYLNFVAFGEGRAVELQWLTNTITQSENFTIERSANGIDFQSWKSIDELDHKNQDAYFEEIDTNPLIGDNYYRLKQVFTDGHVEYSPIELVQFGIDLKGINIFPNPAQEVLNVQTGELYGEGESGAIQLFDAYGRLQKDLKLEEINSTVISISLSEIPNGVYYLKILAKDKKSINRKVIINRLY